MVKVVWNGFAASGTSTLHKVMKTEDYLQILQIHLSSAAWQLKLGHNWVFRQNNDFKHAFKLVLSPH